MIEGNIELAGHTFYVQDGELMVYVPDGEGDSEPITVQTARKLVFLLKLVILSIPEK